MFLETAMRFGVQRELSGLRERLNVLFSICERDRLDFSREYDYDDTIIRIYRPMENPRSNTALEETSVSSLSLSFL